MPAPISDEQKAQDREALLDAAEALFYERGVQAVGMDTVRSASRLPLKRIYALFPTKEDLVVAMLRRRDTRWRASLTEYVEHAANDPRERVLAVFDWLDRWFTQPGFRGCAWINVFGELGSTSPAVLNEVRAHKRAFHDQIRAWVDAAGGAQDAGEAKGAEGEAGAPSSPEPVYLLAEGAIVAASVTGDPGAARAARAAAEALMH